MRNSNKIQFTVFWKHLRTYLAVSSRISFCDCENKSGLSKASEIAIKDSSLEIFHASLSLHVGQFHNSVLPVTLLGLMQNHSWKKISYNKWVQIYLHSPIHHHSTYCILLQNPLKHKHTFFHNTVRTINILRMHNHNQIVGLLWQL
jgi:hypothetical protein